MNRLQASRAIAVVAWVASLAAPFDVAQGRPGAAQRRSMYQAATTLLGSLTPEQRQFASFPFESPERQRWGFDPVDRFPRLGLPMNRMSESQRSLTHALLKTGLSDRGHQVATAIMGRNTVRRADSLNYYVSIFGTPSPDGTWSWRVEGHDLSLNFTIFRGSLVASTPSFFGGTLRPEEDAARALLKTLDAGQRAGAMIGRDAPKEILTTNMPVVRPLPPVGVPVTAMSDGQRELLMQVIRTYTSAMAFEVAEARMARLRSAGLDRIIFSWAGSMDPGEPHYYRVLGPTFVIEYASGSGDDARSVWRDFERDFGRDLLK
jgi:hypothetical protein